MVSKRPAALRSVETEGERNRLLILLKSRGMQHFDQIRAFPITSQGVHLQDVYRGMGGVLTGSARLIQEAGDDAARRARLQEIDRRPRNLEHQRTVLHAKIIGDLSQTARVLVGFDIELSPEAR